MNNGDEPVLCCLCNRSESIQNEQRGPKTEQEKQAKKMREKSAQCFKPAHAGDIVMVPIPPVDRGRAEFVNTKTMIYYS